MRQLVLDASVAVDWLLSDEIDPRAASALARLRHDEAVVPRLWHYEVRNALLVAERRGRMPSGEAAERLAALDMLPILTDDEAELETALDLAFSHGLSFYDALYLELACRLNARLVTLDNALTRAAGRQGLEFPAGVEPERRSGGAPLYIGAVGARLGQPEVGPMRRSETWNRWFCTA